jgi:exopolyphosphatase/guanosine-5'-triphosphate,3'-diphosphate pyrophosphatase
MRYAIIDVGTNSIKLLITETEKNGFFRFISDKINITRLGAGFTAEKILQNEAIEETIKGIREFYSEAIAKGVERKNIFIKGTMCLRMAKNREDFTERLFEELALEIDIISGEEEARLSYLAASTLIKSDKRANLVFDIGGGSTEFILGKGHRVLFKRSINIGAVIITERFLGFEKVDYEQIKLARKEIAFLIDNVFDEILLSGEDVKNIIGIGGTARALAKLLIDSDYPIENIHGFSYNKKTFTQ